MQQEPSSSSHPSTLPSSPTGQVQTEQLLDDVLLIRLGSTDERVVTLTERRMESLRVAVEEALKLRPRLLLFSGSMPGMFTAGADIQAIHDITDPELAAKLARGGQQLFSQIESLPFPTVAAINGVCVGGGFELSLACSGRVVIDSDKIVIGLPEIKLGILPGFGGTQRLPRLVGLPKALDIILAGKTVRPRKAKAIGLVDRVVAESRLLEEARTFGLSLGSKRTRHISLPDKFFTFTSLGRAIVRSSAAKSLKAKTRGHYPAPPAALSSCIVGLERGLSRGYAHEAAELGRLLVSPESKSLVRLFFLTEDSKNIGKSAREDVSSISAYVIGAGTMGAGIAGSLAQHESSVVLKDTSDAALAKGKSHIQETLQKISYLKESDRSFILNRVEFTSRESTSTASADFVIEAIVEDLEIKKKVLAQAAKEVSENAIIATNTSSLSVTEIAQAIPHPERVAGMHFFNPVEKMPLVEVVQGKQSSIRTIAFLAALATKLGKHPIVVADVPGFLVNRILTPYLNEAGFLLQDGFSVQEIDTAALTFGMPMGPLRLLDEVGLDVANKVSEVMLQGYGARMKGPTHVHTLLEHGRLGKKSGAGFYDFPEGQKETPSQEAKKLLSLPERTTSAAGKDEIVERLIFSLLNEAVRCFDEGVAGTPGPEAASQVDLGTVMGMGFPPFRGGALFYAESLGAKKVHETLTRLFDQYGERFQGAPGIARRAQTGGSFLSA